MYSRPVRLSFASVLAALAVAGGAFLPVSAGEPATYKVTIQNLLEGQPLSPPVAATHRPSALMFRPGQLASPGLEAIAEDGNETLMYNRFAGLAETTEAVDVGAPIVPAGSLSFSIRGSLVDRFSLATMLICTNDGFTGLDRVLLPLRGSRVWVTPALDAGTEDNTELSMDIPDPCSALGPAPLAGDPNGNEDDAVDSFPHTPVAPHRGLFGVGDLLDAHAWMGPAAKITMTRVDPDALRFYAHLGGAAENPIVSTYAMGDAVFSLEEINGKKVLHYLLRARRIVDVTQAHLHLGEPDQNGPPVAVLFGPEPPAGLVNGTVATGTIKLADLVGPLAGDFDGLVQALREGRLYVNVHTVDHPTGEIRGQVGTGLNLPVLSRPLGTKWGQQP